MQTFKGLATVRNYQQLMAVLRSRAEQRHISRLEMDAQGNMQSGYSGKLLAPVPIKGLGPSSFGAVLDVLGLDIVVCERCENETSPQSCQAPARQAQKRN